MLQGPGLDAHQAKAAKDTEDHALGFSRLAGEAWRHPLQGFQVQQMHVAWRIRDTARHVTRESSMRHSRALRGIVYESRVRACEGTRPEETERYDGMAYFQNQCAPAFLAACVRDD